MHWIRGGIEAMKAGRIEVEQIQELVMIQNFMKQLESWERRPRGKKGWDMKND